MTSWKRTYGKINRKNQRQLEQRLPKENYKGEMTSSGELGDSTIKLERKKHRKAYHREQQNEF